jgi:hypothetical protein
MEKKRIHHQFQKLPGYREISPEEIAAWDASVERHVIPAIKALEEAKRRALEKLPIIILD